MTDKRTCRRCGLEILDDEQFAISANGCVHLEMWDCVTRLRAENERLCERVETLEKRIQAVVAAWWKWVGCDGWRMDKFDDLCKAIHELEQEASDDT